MNEGSHSHFSALILAGGQGLRAGGNKLMWPFDNALVIDASIKAARSVCRHVRVVVGAYAQELRRHLHDRYPQVEVVENENWQAGGMFSSVRCGLDGMRGPVFVHPGDLPGVPSWIYQTLAVAWVTGNGFDFVKPVYLGRGGHPIVLGPQVIPAILHAPEESDLRTVLSRFDVLKVPVNDNLILRDIDTKTHHESLVSIVSQRKRQPLVSY